MNGPIAASVHLNEFSDRLGVVSYRADENKSNFTLLSLCIKEGEGRFENAVDQQHSIS